MTSRPSFRLGVNYWPACSAMGFWRNWDNRVLTRDFERIKQSGMDSVRIFLTWEDFQPSPNAIDTKALALLKRTLDLASSADLKLIPTLFTGHMSGVNWLPGWAVGRARSEQRFPVVCGGRVVRAKPLDWYSDDVRGAQVRLASECATALAAHPALLAWDLGNENSNCMVAGSRDAARLWLDSISQAIRKNDQQTPITLGLHMEDLEENRGLTPKDASEVCDFLTMHGYPGYADFTRNSTDERLLPFLTQLTRFLGDGKDVLFSEFGVPTRYSEKERAGVEGDCLYDGPDLVPQDDAAKYIDRGLRALHQCGATGAMLWCYSDYSANLLATPPFDRAPHEGSFGIFRSDGTPKPTVEVLRSFASQKPVTASPPRVAEGSFVDLAHDDFYDDPRRHLRRLFARYCSALGEEQPFQ